MDAVMASARRRGMPRAAFLLMVDAESQCLFLSDRGGVRHIYAVSTSARGLGEKNGSLQTPRGWHRVAKRHGHDLPTGAHLVARRFTGTVFSPRQWRRGTGDAILSRVLRLEGLEPGRNKGGQVDSFRRMIYLHGTNHEEHVGVNASSHGCIRMNNRDIVDLFSRVRGRAVWVWIGHLTASQPRVAAGNRRPPAKPSAKRR